MKNYLIMYPSFKANYKIRLFIIVLHSHSTQYLLTKAHLNEKLLWSTNSISLHAIRSMQQHWYELMFPTRLVILFCSLICEKGELEPWDVIQHWQMLLQSAMFHRRKTLWKKALWNFCIREGNEQKVEMVWEGSKSIFCCVFVLHNFILIWRRYCHVTEGWAAGDGGGRYFVTITISEKSHIFNWIQKCYHNWKGIQCPIQQDHRQYLITKQIVWQE